MKDSVKGQILTACEGKRPESAVLEYLVAVWEKYKKGREPICISAEKLRERVSYWSMRTIQRAIAYLVARNFIRVDHSASRDRTNHYTVCMDEIVQKMELFEEVPLRQDDVMHYDTVTQCITTGCRNALRHGDAMIPYMNTSSIPPHILGCDEDKDELINKYRERGIAAEHLEHLLTLHSRQKLTVALEYLAARSKKELIRDNYNVIRYFLNDPSKCGYETDLKTGHLVPARSLVKRHKAGKPTIMEQASLKTFKAERKALEAKWRSMPFEERQAVLAILPSEMEKTRAQRWLQTDPDMINPPDSILSRLAQTVERR